jgi:hypothetical protein
LLICRRLAPVEVNIIHILRSYFNEVVNFIVHLLGLGLVFTVALGRLPSPLAKLAGWLMWYLCTLLPVLNLMYSGFQLAIVAQVEAVFVVGPLILGRTALFVALLLTVLPNIVDYAVTGSVGSLTEKVFEPPPLAAPASAPPPFDFLAWHLTGWTVASIAIFVLSFLGIPLYLTMKNGGFGVNRFNYCPRLTWKRGIFFIFAIGYIWIIKTLAVYSEYDGHVPVFSLVFLITLNLIFVFQLMDEEVSASVRKHWLDTATVQVHPENDDVFPNEISIHGVT